MERVTLTVPDAEYDAWQNEARHHRVPVADWIRRALRLVLESEIQGTTTITGGRKRLSSAVMKCEWCGGGLGVSNPTLRRRFCSDPCRVKAWRTRKRR